MRSYSKSRNVAQLYPVGSLMAIGEIMLLLWITSLLAGMATQIQMSEEPLSAMHDEPPTTKEFDHAVVVGPGKRVSLNAEQGTVDAVIAALRDQPEVKVELRAAEKVNADFLFTCRYRLREAGIGYVERPPSSIANSNTQTGGTR